MCDEDASYREGDDWSGDGIGWGGSVFNREVCCPVVCSIPFSLPKTTPPFFFLSLFSLLNLLRDDD